MSCVRVEFTVVLHRKDQDGVRCTPRVYTLKIQYDLSADDFVHFWTHAFSIFKSEARGSQ